MEEKSLAISNQMLNPSEVVVNASTQSKFLMDIVEKTKCYQMVSGKKYLCVEAWETIGAFNRTHAETESITPIRGLYGNADPTEIFGYQAHVQLWKDGVVVGGAVMPCFFTENCCKGKEGEAKHKACISAAQTFATSKAYRMNFSYVAILAGYQPLPAEEITEDMRVQDNPQGKEHFCEKHYDVHGKPVAFFKKGKMKSYGHPIKNPDGSAVLGEDGKELWCHERTPEGYKAPLAEPEPASAEEAKPTVSMDWLKESLESLSWTTCGKWLSDKYKIPVQRISLMVQQLTPEQQTEFTKEVESRLSPRLEMS